MSQPDLPASGPAALESPAVATATSSGSFVLESDDPGARTDLGLPEPEHAHAVVERLWAALREVEDPEIPVSLVDMGLIVSVDYRVADNTARLQITYTAMGCPAMDMIQDDIRARLLREADVDNVDIDVVWDPVWTHRRLSPAARASMRELGVGV
jgi:metal-sulfur cluster biosynthetic enzyme